MRVPNLLCLLMLVFAVGCSKAADPAPSVTAAGGSAQLAAALPANYSDVPPSASPADDAFWYGMAGSVKLYMFYSESCPHCQEAKPFIAELEKQWPWLEVKRYAVQDHAKFYFNTAKALGANAMSVPGFVFCGQISIGYDAAATTGAELARGLSACHDRRLASLAQ